MQGTENRKDEVTMNSWMAGSYCTSLTLGKVSGTEQVLYILMARGRDERRKEGGQHGGRQGGMKRKGINKNVPHFISSTLF